MKKETIKSVIIGVGAFLVLSVIYEFAVYIWELKQPAGGGAIIRVDIFLIYPVILMLSMLIFFGAKKLLKK